MKKTSFHIAIIVLILNFFSCDFFIKPEKLPKTEQYAKLIGKWKVTESNFLPFEHPSYCEQLELNSVFEFNEYGILKVYRDEKAKQNCNRHQIFWIDENELIAFETDVGFPYEILKLTSDSLVLKSAIVPAFLFKEEKNKTVKDLEDDDIKYIRKNGIVITLKKQKNVG